MTGAELLSVAAFDEVLQGLREENALFEARRCLSCGNRFHFNYDYCKGCGICAVECPCGAIKMVPEEV